MHTGGMRSGGIGEEAPSGALTLSDLIERTGVPASTIHHYRRAGLLPAPMQGKANRFTYDGRHVEALVVIRGLREDRGLSLEDIAEVLPELLGREGGATWPEAGADPCVPGDGRRRAIDAAIGQFGNRSYAEVTMAEVAAAAGMAKGSVYRHFASKEELFLAVVEVLLADTASEFAAAVRAAGGPDGIAGDRDGAAIAFAGVVARAMPILLELGARAAKGHEPSRELARRVLVTLAAAAGRPLIADVDDDEPIDIGHPDAVPAGLALIEQAFAVVLRWSVGDTWPDLVPLGTPSRHRRRPARGPHRGSA
jgi:AcrR family transcriptional regulator